MPRFDLFHEKVRQILLTDWDPIGVRDVPAASDEYNQYVAPIVKMAKTGKTILEVSEYLLEIETGAMGLKGNRGRARVAAEKIFHAVR